MGVRHGYSVYRDARWPPLRLKAKRRDGFKCTNCGARGRLEVHHKIPVRQAPELAFELGNVTCLCPTCHTKETRRELGLEPHTDRQAWRDLTRKGIERKSDVKAKSVSVRVELGGHGITTQKK